MKGMVKVAKYRKKPVEVDAWQFTKENFHKGIPDWIFEKFEENEITEEQHPMYLWSEYDLETSKETIRGKIFTPEGIYEVNEGDWIIKGIYY